MRTSIYIAVVVATLLPIVLRRAYWLRLLCVLFIGFVAASHYTFLLGEHRLIAERGLQQYGRSSYSQLPADFIAATEIARQLSQGEMAPVAVLFTAFGILALFPFQHSENRKKQSHTPIAR